MLQEAEEFELLEDYNTALAQRDRLRGINAERHGHGPAPLPPTSSPRSNR